MTQSVNIQNVPGKRAGEAEWGTYQVTNRGTSSDQALKVVSAWSAHPFPAEGYSVIKAWSKAYVERGILRWRGEYLLKEFHLLFDNEGGR